MNIAHAIGKGMIVFYFLICLFAGILKLCLEISELDHDTLKEIIQVGVFVGIFLAIAIFLICL